MSKGKVIIFFGGAGVQTQDFALHLSHTSNPFCSGYFGDGVW
jgi:hypothetical protein